MTKKFTITLALISTLALAAWNSLPAEMSAAILGQIDWLVVSFLFLILRFRNASIAPAATPMPMTSAAVLMQYVSAKADLSAPLTPGLMHSANFVHTRCDQLLAKGLAAKRIDRKTQAQKVQSHGLRSLLMKSSCSAISAPKQSSGRSGLPTPALTPPAHKPAARRLLP